MLYRMRRSLRTKRFDRAISGILKTKPLVLQDAPWSIVSMVSKRDVPMYLTAMKSFYPKIGRGKIIAIIDRDAPKSLRETLSAHLQGIEFVILEDIPTDPCQRGGTWERLLYCLDRSESEYTIQLDSDTLTVSDDLSEVMECVNTNRAFTMADGFTRVTLLEAAEFAQATPSNFIGIVTEALFDRYPGAETLHYVRGSSGFAGFAKGGYTRSEISVFHQKMEELVGKTRWREWGTEQCGSNFAIANSPNPVVLPYPEYASFNPQVLRSSVKLFHFIGTYRFDDGYFARRSQEVIAENMPGAAPVSPPREAEIPNLHDSVEVSFLRSLTTESLMKYMRWRLSCRDQPVVLQVRTRTGGHSYPARTPRFRLRGVRAGRSDLPFAQDIFIRRIYEPPVWIPRVPTRLIVNIGADIAMSCLWWLSIYSRARVIAFAPDEGTETETRANIAMNDYGSRIELQQLPINPDRLVALFKGQRVDILQMDLGSAKDNSRTSSYLKSLDPRAVVIKWTKSGNHRSDESFSLSTLETLGYRTYVAFEDMLTRIVWGYRR